MICDAGARQKEFANFALQPVQIYQNKQPSNHEKLLPHSVTIYNVLLQSISSHYGFLTSRFTSEIFHSDCSFSTSKIFHRAFPFIIKTFVFTCSNLLFFPLFTSFDDDVKLSIWHWKGTSGQRVFSQKWQKLGMGEWQKIFGGGGRQGVGTEQDYLSGASCTIDWHGGCKNKPLRWQEMAFRESSMHVLNL